VRVVIRGCLVFRTHLQGLSWFSQILIEGVMSGNKNLENLLIEHVRASLHGTKEDYAHGTKEDSG
jgi:hypothetical protein